MDASRILLIRFSSIGDIILTTPLIRAIKQSDPKTILDYITLSEFGALLKDNPFIDNLILIERNKNIFYYIKKALTLKKNKYDFIFDLHRSARSSIFRHLITSGRKNKLKKNYFKRFLLTAFTLNLYKAPFSVIERYYDAAGIKKASNNSGTEIWLSSKEIQQAVIKINDITGANYSLKKNIKDKMIKIESGIIKKKKKVVSIMPFAKWQTKEWGDDKFSDIAKILSEETGAKILILGGTNDAMRAKAVAGNIGRSAILLAGKLTLPETAIALSISDCLISNDTGVMHLGGAVNIPVIALFGCTTEELGFFPVNKTVEIIQIPLNCRPCTAKGLKDCPKKHFKCMNDISVDMVYDAVRKFI